MCVKYIIALVTHLRQTAGQSEKLADHFAQLNKIEIEGFVWPASAGHSRLRS